MAASNSMPDVTGCIIHDRYQLVEMLGCGSYGIVYKAIDLEVEDDSDNIVALKVMPLADRCDDDLATIEREVLMHSAVSGVEGVVMLLDSFDDEMWCCLVLQYCGGGDLFDQSITKLAYQENDELLRKAFLSLVDAVQACHEMGIAHRDLKLENVFTSEDGSRCFLGDFSLATNEPMVCDFGVGTRRYMSPECIGKMTHQQPYDPYLSDIWSLGIILCTMLTGRNPWKRASYNDARFRQFLRDPDLLYNSSPVSEGAQSIIQGLLSPFPEARTSLPALREAVLALDTFFRPAAEVGLKVDYVVPELLYKDWRQRADTAVIRVESEGGNVEPEYASGNMAPEIDILCGAPEPCVRAPWDCSAGSAMDVDMDDVVPCSPSLDDRFSSGLWTSCGVSDEKPGVLALDRPVAITAHVRWDEVMSEA